MNIKRTIFLTIGCISLAIGCIGIIVPFLPSFPFFVVTVYCFAHSSKRMHDWFVGTKMYKNHLEPFVNKKGMTVQTKIRVIVMVTLLLGLGFAMMRNVPVGRLILAIVWIGHVFYFIFGVKTYEKPVAAAQDASIQS